MVGDKPSVSWVTVVESCVESPVVRLVGTAVDPASSVATVSNNGLSIPSCEVCVFWVAVVRCCVVSSVVTLAGAFDDLIPVAVVARVPRAGS